jgi:glutamate-5-semialdehyde dehydrogenase
MSFSITTAAKQAKKAARQVANLTSKQKNQLLADIAESLLANTAAILVANQKDLSAGKENGLDAAMLDRLALDPARIQDIANAVLEIAAQADPVGSISKIERMPSGIQVGKMRIP